MKKKYGDIPTKNRCTSQAHAIADEDQPDYYSQQGKSLATS